MEEQQPPPPSGTPSGSSPSVVMNTGGVVWSYIPPPPPPPPAAAATTGTDTGPQQQQQEAIAYPPEVCSAIEAAYAANKKGCYQFYLPEDPTAELEIDFNDMVQVNLVTLTQSTVLRTTVPKLGTMADSRLIGGMEPVQRPPPLAPCIDTAAELPLRDCLHHLVPSYDMVVVHQYLADGFNTTIKPALDNTTLTREEAEAIYLYSVGLESKDEAKDECTLHSLLNKALLDKTRDSVKQYGSYLKLLLSGLHKIGITKRSVVFRGIQNVSPTEHEKYTEGYEFSWLGFTSTSTRMNTVKQFLGTTGHRIMFIISDAQGYYIKPCSAYEDEDELLLPPVCRFRVDSNPIQVAMFTMIHLTQIPPTEDIMENLFGLNVKLAGLVKKIQTVAQHTPGYYEWLCEMLVVLSTHRVPFDLATVDATNKTIITSDAVLFEFSDFGVFYRWVVKEVPVTTGVDYFQQYTTSKPRCAVGWCWLAYFDEKNKVQHCLRSIQEDDSFSYPYFFLANTLPQPTSTITLPDGTVATQQDLYKLAIQHDDKNSYAYYNLGTTLPQPTSTITLPDGTVATQQDLFKLAIQHNDKNSYAYYALGNTLPQPTSTITLPDGTIATKQDLYKLAIQHDDKYSKAYNNLGATLSQPTSTITLPDGTVATKQDLYKLAIQHNDKNSYAYKNLGLTLPQPTSTITLPDGTVATQQDLFKLAKQHNPQIHIEAPNNDGKCIIQ